MVERHFHVVIRHVLLRLRVTSWGRSYRSWTCRQNCFRWWMAAGSWYQIRLRLTKIKLNFNCWLENWNVRIKYYPRWLTRGLWCEIHGQVTLSIRDGSRKWRRRSAFSWWIIHIHVTGCVTAESFFPLRFKLKIIKKNQSIRFRFVMDSTTCSCSLAIWQATLTSSGLL